MKTMTCEQTGGTCAVTFQGETLEDIAEQSKQHAMELVAQGDKAHLEKMDEMRQLMQQPEAIKAWQATIQATFDALPED